MLRTAFCPVIRDALEAADTIEIMANPDGSVWIEKTGAGLILSDHRLDASDRERVIRLVASSAGEALSRTSPIVSAELPGGGERFERGADSSAPLPRDSTALERSRGARVHIVIPLLRFRH